ncbi:putative defense protein 3 isoform X1 [Strongylocentrotus purpuratus]|uniref:Reelin domain-containing protein n=1 Tax=Strongylocentrotus purpuratus TaxID=7668 RepID=A0A7M7G4G0_STRPU|nr:putative defense protein 3 isoform X1 [Strongylocentrotus purpuratus]|eukprot:XP_001201345.1 PREDICTED: putative defense protein 3 isoform X1 [Strongylocentrotus purpuratus]
MKSARVQTSLLLVAVVLAILFASSEAYENGAPVSACVTATPGHVTGETPIPPQTGDGPYNITFDVQEYVRGDEVQVTIEGTFQGFLLQARRVSDDVPVGTFTAPNATIGKLLLCTTSNTTVTHTNMDEKTDQVFTWQVPDAGTGDVRFFATVATDHDNFYVGILSEILGDSVTDAPTTMGEPTTAEMTTANEPTTAAMTTANAVRLSTGFGILLLAVVISVLQLFA